MARLPFFVAFQPDSVWPSCPAPVASALVRSPRPEKTRDCAAGARLSANGKGTGLAAFFLAVRALSLHHKPLYSHLSRCRRILDTASYEKLHPLWWARKQAAVSLCCSVRSQNGPFSFYICPLCQGGQNSGLRPEVCRLLACRCPFSERTSRS